MKITISPNKLYSGNSGSFFIFIFLASLFLVCLTGFYVSFCTESIILIEIYENKKDHTYVGVIFLITFPVICGCVSLIQN